MNKQQTDIKKYIIELITQASDTITVIEEIREYLHTLCPLNSQPIDRVRWIHIDKITPNDYNPNSVAKTEMGLLYTSILHDGYTQPIVTIYDPEIDKYVIVDGFHRYFICKTNKDIFDRNKGLLPVVVINKDINDRMASTIRHNRARGMHSVTGMSSMVFEMLSNGWSEEAICNELGMQAEEILKLKHITGFSALFKNTQYNQAWETDTQIKERAKHIKGLTQAGKTDQ